MLGFQILLDVLASWLRRERVFPLNSTRSKIGSRGLAPIPLRCLWNNKESLLWIWIVPHRPTTSHSPCCNVTAHKLGMICPHKWVPLPMHPKPRLEQTVSAWTLVRPPPPPPPPIQRYNRLDRKCSKQPIWKSGGASRPFPACAESCVYRITKSSGSTLSVLALHG